MKLIVGLGNYGKKYEDTWHNAGFVAIDEFFRQQTGDFKPWKNSAKFKAEISEGARVEEKMILAKPQTYMNNSGQAVKALAYFYKVDPADIWIIHDDIDLPLGTLRISHNASAAGHRGVQSIIDELGGQHFVRFRLGIRPAADQPIPTEAYVLQKMDKEGKLILAEAIKEALAAIELSLLAGVSQAMNEFN